MHRFPHRCLSAQTQGYFASSESKSILLIWNPWVNNLHYVKDFHLTVTALFLSSNSKHQLGRTNKGLWISWCFCIKAPHYFHSGATIPTIFSKGSEASFSVLKWTGGGLPVPGQGRRTTRHCRWSLIASSCLTRKSKTAHDSLPSLQCISANNDSASSFHEPVQIFPLPLHSTTLAIKMISVYLQVLLFSFNM